MKTQTQDLIVRLTTAASVAMVMLVTLQGIGNLSQHRIERSLAQDAAHTATVQLARAANQQQA
ncbi:hypothetical protein GCM10007907_08860 [Chitinimonas prasina]|uniref:Methyl-accepting chemotaxis protein n=1 Tax=Chitinimonas prasina TaxID=1434937 RepID=A0ABQ5YAX3_9NEIS|nr:hypothetical protein [Chitinimonas prasina]GLR12096.1 hypothetical protein GCM10007907_08860 [Chitinimonas prasina]